MSKKCCYKKCKEESTVDGFVYSKDQEFVEASACDKHKKKRGFFENVTETEKVERVYLTYLDENDEELTLSFRSDDSLTKYITKNEIEQVNIIKITSIMPMRTTVKNKEIRRTLELVGAKESYDTITKAGGKNRLPTD